MSPDLKDNPISRQGNNESSDGLYVNKARI